MGVRIREDGFTLMEMLVVLSILALMVWVTPRLSGSPGLRVRAAVSSLAADLRSARQMAISRHAIETVTLTPHGYRMGPDALGRAFPASVSINVTPEIPDLLGHYATVVQFFPDGSSSGGIVTVTDGATHGTLRVYWLDGGVMVNAA